MSLAASAAFAEAATVPIPDALKTPRKTNRLVVPPSDDGGAFDTRGADVPFVFRHLDRFHMTCVGFDG